MGVTIFIRPNAGGLYTRAQPVWVLASMTTPLLESGPLGEEVATEAVLQWYFKYLWPNKRFMA
jgi:hypothetical protein